jgi:hypothetical protein
MTKFIREAGFYQNRSKYSPANNTQLLLVGRIKQAVERSREAREARDEANSAAVVSGDVSTELPSAER